MGFGEGSSVVPLVLFSEFPLFSSVLASWPWLLSSSCAFLSGIPVCSSQVMRQLADMVHENLPVNSRT